MAEIIRDYRKWEAVISPAFYLGAYIYKAQYRMSLKQN